MKDPIPRGHPERMVSASPRPRLLQSIARRLRQAWWALQMIRVYKTWFRAISNRLSTPADDPARVLYRLRSGVSLHASAGAPDVRIVNEVYVREIYDRGGDFRPKAGWVVADIGAQKGFFTVRAALAGARVVAVEPIPFNLDFLRSNITGNGLSSVAIIEAAVAADPGRGVMRFRRSDTGRSSLIAPAQPGLDEVEVTVISLEHVLSTAGGNVDLMKMDIEGVELDVLQAVEGSVLRRCVSRLVLEYHAQRDLSTDAVGRLLVQTLEAAGFRCSTWPEIRLLYAQLD